MGQVQMQIEDRVATGQLPCGSLRVNVLFHSKLRKRGVTLHLLLESDREDIPDVPAVYFVEPTAENIQRIGTGQLLA
jgi:hypothetical protein